MLFLRQMGVPMPVISSQVFEHLETPLVAIAETHRLLKQEGLFFLSFPFLHPIHAAPRDFMRYTEFYIHQEIAADKFHVIDIQRVGGFWYMIGACFGIYFYEFDRGMLKRLHIIPAIYFCFSVLCRVLHCLEGAMLKVLGKDASGCRAKWTMNYVCLLKKK
jgi:SAM-dependent methyltransferase